MLKYLKCTWQRKSWPKSNLSGPLSVRATWNKYVRRWLPVSDLVGCKASSIRNIDLWRLTIWRFSLANMSGTRGWILRIESPQMILLLPILSQATCLSLTLCPFQVQALETFSQVFTLALNSWRGHLFFFHGLKTLYALLLCLYLCHSYFSLILFFVS